MTCQKRIFLVTLATLSLSVSLPLEAQESAPTRLLTFHVETVRVASDICADNDKGGIGKLVEFGRQYYVEGYIDNVLYFVQCTDNKLDGSCGELQEGKEYLAYWVPSWSTQRGPKSQDQLILRFPQEKTASGKQPLPLQYYLVSEQQKEQ